VEPLGPASDGAEAEPSPNGYPVVAIVGPTAAGKSALALKIAELFGGEIINYDSVQVYRGFDIGAGKVPTAERRRIAHRLLDALEPDQTFTAGDYRREALRVLAGLRERAKLPILVGGTGLYLRALLLGLFEGPPRSEALRARLRARAARRGRESLHRLLERFDPATAARIAPRDTQKVIRAVEVCLLSRRPISALLAQGRAGLPGFRVFKIGLNPERAQLYARIDRRAEQMFAAGLLQETRALLARSEGRGGFKALEALGYREARAVLEGKMNAAEAVRQTQAATRHYAKRQMTWFRREAGITWFAGFGDDPEIETRVFDWLNRQLSVSAGRPA